MGQKVNPIAFRLGKIRSSSSNWFAKGKQYADYVYRDIKLREFLLAEHQLAGIAEIKIERTGNTASVTIICSRPGVIIGKKGSDVESLKNRISRFLGCSVHVTVKEEKKPDLNANIVATTISAQLEKRVMYRKAMKRAMQSAMRAGAKGVKIMVSGRLNGAEIARKELYKEGRVPLHTIRSDVDYAMATAHTTYGALGVKVWIYRGEVLKRNRYNMDSEVRSSKIEETQ